MSKLWRRLLFVLRRGRFERELEEEMRFHLEMKAQSGGRTEEARYAAQRKFGNTLVLREASPVRLERHRSAAPQILDRGFASHAAFDLGDVVDQVIGDPPQRLVRRPRVAQREDRGPVPSDPAAGSGERILGGDEHELVGRRMIGISDRDGATRPRRLVTTASETHVPTS